MNTKVSLPILLLLSAYMLSTASAPAQIVIDNIDDFAGAASDWNCTSQKQNVPPPGWEWNCDPGSGNCSTTSTSICGKSELETTVTRDGQAREMDVSFNTNNGANHGGMLFHAAINSSGNGNLDPTDTHFSWGGWFYYTALQDGSVWSINQLEFDLNQVLDNGDGTTDTMIYAAQCDFTRSGGEWSFSNGWTIHSTIPCPRSQWTTNGWHHVVISAHRCASHTKGSCSITYDSVSFDENTINCTGTCSANGAFTCPGGSCWSPVGLLLQNVQLDMNYTADGSMTSYADLMTTNSPESTQVATPAFSITTTTVEISDGTSGATICYTTDGTTPTGNGGGTCTHGETYTGPINYSSGELLSAIGSKDGIDFDSAVGMHQF